MPLDPRRVKELFSAALVIPEVPARRAFLDRECGADAELRQGLEELLAAHAAAVHEATVTFEPLHAAGRGEAVGSIIAGKYRLVQEIGEGGMGSVFRADQLHPVKRQVAVKVIKAGMDSAGVLARFDAERQALALMDHPHIAKVLDAGTTETGRPFFVMELVKGVPLTKYCDDHKLSVADRLRLFMEVCSAVQHAHQKGIIHRDLKPSNILVESHDGKPVSKTIDFGLAKATSGTRLTEQTLFTALGAVAGTPLYMAPEQATFDAVDVDTRADVYALGVILYELLTGTTPIERATFKKAAFDEMLRVIRELEPPVPSSRISSSDARASVAALRQMEPARLGRFVRGELDWIVMKSLSKERERRYESATAFAKDLERFLNHEPVQAGPPSAGYKLRKFVQRNRLQVIAASLVLFALIVGIVGTTTGLVRAEFARAGEVEQRTIAEQREREAKTAEQLAVQRQLEEKKAREQAEEVSRFMQQVFAQGSALGQASKTRKVDKALTVKDAMDYAAKAIEGKFAGRPELEAALRSAIGRTYLELGAFPEAEVHLRKARELLEATLGEVNTNTISSVNNLAALHASKGEYPAAESLYKLALERCEREFGDDHPDTLTAVNNLAMLYQDRQNYVDAQRLHLRALSGRETKLGMEDPVTLTSVNNLGLLYLNMENNAAAEPLCLRAVAGCEKVHGLDHPDTLISLNNLAALYRAKGDYKSAEPLFKQVLAGSEKVHGPDHPETLGSVNNLAALYYSTQDYAAAEPLFQRAIAGAEKTLGVNHSDTLKSVRNLAEMRYMMAESHNAIKDFAAAEPLYLRAVAGMERAIGADDPETLARVNNLAVMYWKWKRPDKAIPLFERLLERAQAENPGDHPDTVLALANLGVNYRDADRLDDAIRLLEQAHKSSSKYMQLAWVGDQLLDAYRKAGKRTETSQLATRLLAEKRRSLTPGSPELGGLLAKTGITLLEIDPVAAEPILRECLEVREKLAPQAWSTANARSLLGGALLMQKKYADAEPLLLAGYKGLKADEQGIPLAGKSNIPDAIRRLIALYEATEKPDDAAKWRKELSELNAKVPPPK
ncbi:MAG: serine/threonine protein kinase [Pirellulaceae bacterium]|nr:serine/threonine protein kinase [Pirellulaceae bacterium]